jgi:hypothetical protein
VWVVMLMADEDALAGTSHTMFHIVLLQPLKTCEDGGIFFGLGLFSAECVVGEGVEADGLRLVVVEGFGKDGRVGGLKSGGGDC